MIIKAFTCKDTTGHSFVVQTKKGYYLFYKGSAEVNKRKIEAIKESEDRFSSLSEGDWIKTLTDIEYVDTEG